MGTKDSFGRKVDLSGCKVIGNTIAAMIKALAEKGETFSPDFQKSLNTLQIKTTQIAEEIDNDPSIFEVDNDVDTIIGAFEDYLDSLTKIFQLVSYMPLSDAAQKIYEAASELYPLCFPEGTGYLRAPNKEQWSNLNTLSAVLKTDGAVKLIQRLGIEAIIERVQTTIDEYGNRLGITKAREDIAEKLRALRDGWHQAYGRVLIQASAAYDADDETAQPAKLALFTKPHEEYTQRARENEQKYREERKRKQQTPTLKED
jgi:hypothetical protein